MKRTTRPASRQTLAVGGKRYFSPQRAQRTLVLVRRIVGDVVEEYPRLLECQEMLESAQRHGSPEYLHRLQQDMMRSAGRLQGYVDELAGIGVELSDFAHGRVEFPAWSTGREIRLCWQHGEAGINCWYDPNLAQPGRRPIEELATA